MTKMQIFASAVDTVPTINANYIYDGMGRRVAKIVNGVVTKYLYDNEDILLELDENDNVIACYTHGPGIDEPLIMQRDTDNDGTLDASYFFVTDGLGSIVKLVDTSGNVVNNYVYDSFGNMLDKTEAVPNFYTYTGREYDGESGLYYYRSRYYDASIGRFLNNDSLGLILIRKYSRLLKRLIRLNKLKLNDYQYVKNNPVNFIDPFGFDECSSEDGDDDEETIKIDATSDEANNQQEDQQKEDQQKDLVQKTLDKTTNGTVKVRDGKVYIGDNFYLTGGQENLGSENNPILDGWVGGGVEIGF